MSEPLQTPEPRRENVGLTRGLGPIMAIAVVAGTVIGSGIFKKPQAVAENIPYSGLAAIVWIAGGLLALLGALAYAEVAALLPRAGGNYVFLREGFGRLAGFLWGWVDFFLIRCGSIAALATIFTQSLSAILSQQAPEAAAYFTAWPRRFFTVFVILLLAYINIRGIRWGGILQLAITCIKVGSLLFLLALPFLLGRAETYNLYPWWPEGEALSWTLVGGFASALLAVQWAYHGWMNLTPVAEEVKDPQRNLPRALLVGVGIVIVLYLGVNMSYALVLSQEEMKQMKESAETDKYVAIGFSRSLLGPIGLTIAAAAVMFSVFGALNGNLLVGPRLLFAMSADRFAPRQLGDVHARYHTPAKAIAVLAVWASLLILGVALLTEIGLLDEKKDHFDILTNLAMFGATIFETMAVMCVFIFRRTMPDAERPYRCWGYPWVPALYVILPILILGNMYVNQLQEAIIGMFVVLSGIIVYMVITRLQKPLAA